jgi:hypothetical protein
MTINAQNNSNERRASSPMCRLRSCRMSPFQARARNALTRQDCEPLPAGNSAIALLAAAIVVAILTGCNFTPPHP